MTTKIKKRFVAGAKCPKCGAKDSILLFKENGIETMIHYPIPPHKQKALANWNQLSFPITEKIHDEVLSIPLNSGLKASEIQHIITVLNKF